MKTPMKKILVATDGSPGSEAAFPALMPMLRTYKPELAVLYVFANPESSFVPPSEVAKSCQALRRAGINAYLETREGRPEEEILRAAREMKADLLAISTHGRAGVARMISGSVAESVLRHIEIPLLITRPGVVVRGIQRIVVALDGSAHSEAALQDAAQLSRDFGAELEVIQVSFPIMAGPAGEIGYVMPPEDPMPYLKRIVEQLEHEGVPARAVALQGRPPEEIVRYLKDSEASLLCMTTHGRGGLARFLLGSVAEEVLRRAPCPVLLRRSVVASAASPAASKEVPLS